MRMARECADAAERATLYLCFEPDERRYVTYVVMGRRKGLGAGLARVVVHTGPHWLTGSHWLISDVADVGVGADKQGAGT